MVDRTAEAFGMQPATSRGRNVPRRNRVEEQTEEAFATEEPKGIGYAELLLDNIIGLDNQYESTGEAFGKAFNEDELGTLKNMAVSAYEGAKEFVTSPIETTGNIVNDIRDSVYRLGSEDLDARIKRMYGIGYQDATDEQVTKAREAVIGDAVTASSLIPAAKGIKSVATAARTRAIIPNNLPTQELLDYNASVRKPSGLLDRDRVLSNDNILYRPDRVYRFIGRGGYEDFVNSGLIRAKQGTKQDYGTPYFMKGKSSSRYGEGKSGEFLVETIPSKEKWTGAAESYEKDKYVGPKSALTKDDPIRIFKRQEDGSYEIVYDNIGDAGLIPKQGYAEGGVVDRTAEAFGMDEPVRGSRGRNVPRRNRVEDQTEEAFAEPELDVFSLPMGADPAKDALVGEDELGNKVYKSPLGVRYTIKTVQPPERFTTEPATMARVGEVAQQYATGAIEGLTGAITAPGRALAGEPVTTGEVLDTAGFAATGAIPGIARGAIEGAEPDVLYTGAGQAAAKPKRPSVPRFERDARQDAVDAFADAFSLPDDPFATYNANSFLNTDVGEFRKFRNIDVSDIPEYEGGGYFYLENIRIHDLIKAEVDGTPTEKLIDDVGLDPEPEAVAFVERMRNSLRADKEDAEFVEKYKTFLQNYPNYDPYDMAEVDAARFSRGMGLGSGETLFRSPIESIIQQLEYPRDGIKGAQFLKELKDNPDVRDSEVAGIGLDIDPQKRYTQQELMDAVSGRLYDVRVSRYANYDSYQRQQQVGLVAPEKDYFELTIDATPRGDNPGFKAKSQHYDENTLAHTRASVRSDTLGDYILVEEMQSDLLQKGFDRTPVGPSPDNVYSQFQIRLHESEIEGILKASPEEIQKGMSMAVLREETNNLTGKDFQNAEDALSAFAARSTEGEWNSYKLFRTIHTDYLKYDPNVPVDVAKEAFNDIKDYITKKGIVKRNVPPIAKTEESVRLAIDALMAEGLKRNVSRIVIPPFEKIVEARFRGDPDAYNKALDPKSGFYATYVTSVNKVLDKYKKEFGDDFAVIPHEIEYKYKNAFGYNQTEVLTGIEIDFSGLLNKGYNLNRPRFAQGGMVDYNTETQMNRLMQEGGIADDGMRRDPVSGNEIPPGSMATEVRDDIPAQLSEGEYIVPADVLRYYGVAFFEQLRAKAKRGLAEMEAGGRIGGEPVEMEDEDELPFDISELETAGDDTDMQMAAMGMAKGGVVKMQEGGVTTDATATKTFDPTMYQTPGGTLFNTSAGAQQQQKVEYRVYQNAQGQTMSILFINGVAQQPIPEGFFPQGEGPKVEEPVPADRGDRDEAPQAPQKSFNEYTVEDWISYKPDTGVGSTLGQIAGGIIGGALLGPAGAMLGAKGMQESMARNSISAYNSLNEYVGAMNKSDPNYSALADKRNKMYGDLTAAQEENPGFFSNIINSVFGKPTINPPKTGAAAAARAATTAATPAAAPAATQRTEREAARRETGLAQQEAAAATQRTAREAARRETGQAQQAAAEKSKATSAATAKSYKDIVDEQYGALAKGGLMMKKPQPKKTTQKRKIKTVST